MRAPSSLPPFNALLNRRRLLGLWPSAPLSGAPIQRGAWVMADDGPGRPVKVVAPHGAGGPTDSFAGMTADGLSKSFAQTPTLSETTPGLAMTGRSGYFAPCGAPRLILDRLFSALA